MNGVPGPIPWTAIQEYGAANGFEGEELDYLFAMVRAQDAEFMRFIGEQHNGNT